MVLIDARNRQFGVRGAAWLKNPSEEHPILDNPETTKRAESLQELAAMSGLPGDALVQSVQEFNASIDAADKNDSFDSNAFLDRCER